nr:helix-turn-helix transcriptional regulator [uncultured Gemmiger sp.]
MPAQWTGVLVGRMHNAGVTAKQLAEELGKNPKYISGVLNGHYSPKKAEQEFNEAFQKLLDRRSV